MIQYEPRIDVVYRPEIVGPSQDGYSRSPLKPALWMQHIEGTPLGPLVDVRSKFERVDYDDLDDRARGYIDKVVLEFPVENVLDAAEPEERREADLASFEADAEDEPEED